MHPFIDSILKKIDDLHHTPTQASSWVPIPLTHIDDLNQLPPKLIRDEHYFEVWVNEMYLAYDREWFKTYNPMVVAVTEFSYAGKDLGLPYVVGPNLISSGVTLPQGMLFTNTRIAGPRPYKGDQVTVALVLCKLQVDDLLRKLVDALGNFAGLLNLTTGLGASLQITNSVMDMIDALTGTDGKATPVIGVRSQFSPVVPGYFALIDQSGIAPEKLWVKNKRLFYGETMESAVEFRQADYILFSLCESSTEEIDVSRLPFYNTYQSMLLEANQSAKEEIWANTKANLAALLGMLDTSPDLTGLHASSLGDQWIETVTVLHKRAERVAHLGPGEKETAAQEEPSPLERVRDKAISVLNL
jgi:hypothetical protein